ncbi:MAG: ribonuclease R [Proteobacteria bacterium]|nr:ribonuclease R [Pseudomonadota bacterium]
MAKPTPDPSPFPTRDQILAYLKENSGAAGKREISHAFRIDAADRVKLRRLLNELERDGSLERVRRGRSGRAKGRPRALPEVLVLDVTGTDLDGEVLARPAAWDPAEPVPTIYLSPGRAGAPAAGVGDRVLARLKRSGPDEYAATPIRALPRTAERMVGVFERRGDDGRIKPTDRRQRDELQVLRGDEANARHGDLVLAELVPTGRLGLRQARVIERLGVLGEPRSISLIAIHGHDIPTEFDPAALALAAAAEPVTLGDRADLRAIPLVTIDGADARDFDDAVFAQPDGDPANPEGWHLIVAIADVAHYVRPGDALDQAAHQRGNSVYFPDRVVPMLPEQLSNELCSLRPHEERACMAVHVWIDRDGNKLSHRFVRGLMRSAARLTYEEAQLAYERGAAAEVPEPVRRTVVPLYGAFRALARAREARGTLDLDLVERQVMVDAAGAVTAIVPRPRLDSHRLIEEFMILANVCAAETLEAAGRPCMYRVHDAPSAEKLEALRGFLDGLHIRFPKGQVVKPRNFMAILKRVADTPHQTLVNEVVLRSQAQAAYSPHNIGHFGLALRRYAHFTSPIRRYADLLVHRSLIKALGLGSDGLPDGLKAASFEQIGDQISATERRAAQAEREVVDRYTAAYLAAHVGASFAGRISGVTRFGLFIKLSETGADGLVPMRALPSDFYQHDEQHHRLVGKRTRRTFTLGDSVEVRLAEADVVTGSLILALLTDGADPAARAPKAAGGKSGHRSGGRPAGRRRRGR